VAEKNVSRFRRDERRGVMTRIPADVAQALPEEGELEWTIDPEENAIRVQVVETTRRAVKLKA
jgi:hypothetical protein